jgi:3-methyladenine DNA glycosylase/8-oxoguanine DNA glycosylase
VPTALEIPLEGPKGEPGGPNKVDLEGRTLETTLPTKSGARTVRVSADKSKLRIEVMAGSFDPQLTDTMAHMFRLDEDLSGFYALVGGDPDLEWSAQGAGRMLRAPTFFEDVVKTT